MTIIRTKFKSLNMKVPFKKYVLKEGTKIVCINTNEFKDKNKVCNIILNKVYTVINDRISQEWNGYEIGGKFYHPERFITLNEWRNKKIKLFLHDYHEQ